MSSGIDALFVKPLMAFVNASTALVLKPDFCMKYIFSHIFNPDASESFFFVHHN
jgi:hypothetical protein